MTARSTYTLPAGEYGLMVKLVNGGVQLVELPTRTAVDPEAPVLTYHYIESPDGVFHYPLFSTAEEANYYDSQNGGTGTGSSHTHAYADDPTNTVWHMPDNGSTMTGTSAPVDTSEITYNVITTEADSLHVPTAFADQTITVNEGEALNLQLHPTGNTGFTTTIGGIPAFTLVNGYLQGTAPEVTGDNVANPSDTTTVTVYRTNVFGTSQGTLTININNLTVPSVNITGVTDEGPATLTGTTANDSTWFSLNETLSAGERLVFTGTFLDDVFNSMDNYDQVFIGLKDTSWANTLDGSAYGDSSVTGFYGGLYVRLYKNQNAQKFAYLNYNGNQVALGAPSFTAGNSMTALNMFLEVTGSGNNIRGGWEYGSTDSVTATTYGNWTTSKKYQTGEQSFGITAVDVVIYYDKAAGAGQSSNSFDFDGPDWTALTEQTIPTAPTNLTSWTKALDFSGSNEHLKQVSTSTQANPLRMTGLSTTVPANSDSSKTSASSSARPWATAIVFKSDGHSSNQHIWNSGEGAGSTDDNIYLRIDSNGQLYFGWGRSGALNECALGSTTVGRWYGVYIAHKGTRLSGNDATAANLAAAFDIRITTDVGNWTGATYNYSQSFTWSNNGGRMDRSILGDFTIGGRGANRTFHGKVASMVITTLRTNFDMPDTTEIELMISDPKKWEDDYRNGQFVRWVNSTSYSGYTPSNINIGFGAVQIWLMGDGSNDSYSNGIRNQVYPSDQNYTKLQFNSMVSNDIETVNISGLS